MPRRRTQAELVATNEALLQRVRTGDRSQEVRRLCDQALLTGQLGTEQFFIETGLSMVSCSHCGRHDFNIESRSINQGQLIYCRDCFEHTFYCDDCSCYQLTAEHIPGHEPQTLDLIPAPTSRRTAMPTFTRPNHIEPAERSYEWYHQHHVRNYTTQVHGELGFLRTPDENRIYRDRVDAGRSDELLYVGVELEVEPKQGVAATLPQTTSATLNGLAMLKRDSSLSSRGFEVVSAPATADYHLSGVWDRFFNESAKHLLSYDTQNCGLHFHLSAAPVGRLVATRVMLALNDPAWLPFLNTMAGRELTPDHRYTRLEPHRKAGDVMKYAIHEPGCPWSREMRNTYLDPRSVFIRDDAGDFVRDRQGNKIIRTKPGQIPSVRRRCPCNVRYDPNAFERHSIFNINTGKGTVEFRMFRGTVSPERFFADMQFCLSIVEYCTLYGGVDKTKKDHPNLDKFGIAYHEDYLGWIGTQRRKKYRHLHNFLVKNALVEAPKQRMEVA